MLKTVASIQYWYPLFGNGYQFTSEWAGNKPRLKPQHFARDSIAVIALQLKICRV